MRINRTVRVGVPLDDAWRLVGPGFADVDRWASNVFVSTQRSDARAPQAAPVGGRVCATPQGEFDEAILAYDEDRHRVAYSVKGAAIPGFVRSIAAEWNLKSRGDKVTDVTMTMEADITQPFAFLMGWMMKKQFGKAIDETFEEYKHYLETGRLHPRKTKSNGSKKAQKARAAA
ncbi:MAG: SRPBCC family protein [Woeseiaceae bacterium]|nr:SRPBCC family protein [Woeseiaceae bacterium]